MKCKNLLVRKRKYKPYFYCKELKKEIILSQCENCLKLNLVTTRPIRKISNHRKTVSKSTYQKVYERDNGQCRLCGSNQIQLHHIIYRSEDKSLIDEPSNCIMLCVNCHQLVHSNKKIWQKKLKEIIK